MIAKAIISQPNMLANAGKEEPSPYVFPVNVTNDQTSMACKVKSIKGAVHTIASPGARGLVRTKMDALAVAHLAQKFQRGQNIFY